MSRPAGAMVAHAWSVVLFGFDGQVVHAQAAVGPATHTAPPPHLVSPETTDRIRRALRHTGVAWPAEPVSLALSPTGPGTGCEVALACALLAATGAIPADRLERTVLLGALDAHGGIQPVRGVLPALLAARRDNIQRAVVPRCTLGEAALVGGLEVLGADQLAEVLAWLRGEDGRLCVPATAQTDSPDLIEVIGQPQARWALEVAAAGGHNMLLIGQPGRGATMLARCLSGLLPPLTHEQALEVTAIHSLNGTLNPDSPLITTPPFIAPHHTVSVPALLGGGIGLAKPGAVSQAHHGVLFLAAAELGPHRLESLRTVVEDGEIRLTRRDSVARYPARFLLVLAANPCPGGCAREADCSCSPNTQRRYLARLSGPLLDRIDLRVQLRPAPHAGQMEAPAPETTSAVRTRVAQARHRAARRWAAHGWRTNAEVPTHALRREFALPQSVTTLLDRGLASGAVTARGADRCLRVAWTLADLTAAPQPEAEHIAAALQLRDRRPS